MIDLALEHGMPAKVLSKAHQLGLHNDCLVAGAEKACDSCTDHIKLAFDFFYGDSASLTDLLSLIIDDFKSDLDGE